MEEYAHYVPLPQRWVRKGAINISREYSNSCDHIITPTTHVAERLRRYQVTKPITVIPTGIDIDLLDNIEEIDIRALYNIPSDVPLLSYAGRVAKEKNMPRLIGAFREVLKKEPDAHLLIIGGGPDEAAVRHLCDTFAITHRSTNDWFCPACPCNASFARNRYIYFSLRKLKHKVWYLAKQCRAEFR